MFKKATTYTAPHKEANIDISYDDLIDLIGQPHYCSVDDNYPDDTDKTDVCWSFQAEQNIVSIWNYKNGPNYCGATLESINFFSVYYTDLQSIRSFCEQFGIDKEVITCYGKQVLV